MAVCDLPPPTREATADKQVCGRSTMVVYLLPKQKTGVRFSSPAPGNEFDLPVEVLTKTGSGIPLLEQLFKHCHLSSVGRAALS